MSSGSPSRNLKNASVISMLQSKMVDVLPAATGGGDRRLCSKRKRRRQPDIDRYAEMHHCPQFGTKPARSSSFLGLLLALTAVASSSSSSSAHSSSCRLLPIHLVAAYSPTIHRHARHRKIGFGGVYGNFGEHQYATHYDNPSSRHGLQMVGTADRRATDDTAAADMAAHSAEIDAVCPRKEQNAARSEAPAFDGNKVVEKQKQHHELQKTEAPESAETTSTHNSNKEEMKRQLAELLNERKQRQSFGGGGVAQNSASSAEDTYLKVLMGVGGTPPPPSQSADGLSKYHQRLLTPTIDRQRFVTGRYPLYVTVKENPTRRWLRQVGSKRAAATSEVLINGTSIDRSLASYDRFQWLDGEENVDGKGIGATTNGDEYDAFSLELLAEIYVRKPGYVNILAGDGAGSSGAAARELKEQYKGWNRWRFHADNPFHKRWWLDEQESDRLWITGFSLTKQAGELTYVDVDTGHIGTVNKRTAKAIRWPNEVNSVPVQMGEARNGAPRQH